MKYADYGWIATSETGDITDAEWERIDGPGNSRVNPKDQIPINVVGPSNIHPAVQTKLEAGHGKVFRLYNDDGVLDCSGRWIEDAVYSGLMTEAEVDDWSAGGDPLGDYGGMYGSTSLVDGNGKGII